MKKTEYKQMAHYERYYWWHIGRLKIIEKQIMSISGNRKIRILNVGCGTGGTIDMLSKYGDVKNIDVSKHAIKFIEQAGYTADLYDGGRLPYTGNSFDLVVALDVLEHIENEDSAISEWHRVLKKNGSLLITVPAYQWLWSGHDESLNHYRRYTKNKLNRVVTEANFTCAKLSYAMMFSFIMVAGFRIINKVLHRKIDDRSSYVKIPALINKLFIYFLSAESKILGSTNIPFGTTVLGLYKKR